MTDLKIRPYDESDEAAVVQLWQDCGLMRPWNDPIKDIQRKLLLQRELFLVGTVDDRLVGTVMAGYEGHRGWINYLAVAPDSQKNGCGRQLMNEAERLLRAAGCPKINLQVRTTNKHLVAFYERLGFSIDEAISMGKRLVED